MLRLALRILTCNVNGIRDNTKRKNIFQYLQKSNSNIVLLQETHSSPSTNNIWSKEWDGKIIWNSGTNFKCGVAILIKNNTNIKILQTNQDTQGRILSANIEYNNQKMQIINIYAPNKPNKKPTFFENVNQYIQPNLPLILGGDYNMVLDPSIDRKGGTPSVDHISGHIELSNIIKENQLLDVWRHIHKNKKMYTWSSPDNKIHSRLDRIYISQQNINKIHKTQTMSIPWTDHKLFSTTILLNNNNSKGPNYWKLNTSILRDQHYQELIEDFWLYWQKQKTKYKNFTDWWDVGKCHIKSLSTKYSINKIQQQKQTIQKLIQNISDEKSEKSPNQTKIQNYNQQLQTIYSSQNEGVIIRSKQNLVERGEKPTKFFFQQEKINQNKKHFSKLKTGENTYTSNHKIILSSLKTFYKNLYTKVPLCENTQNKLLNNITKQIPDNDKNKLEQTITSDELLNALKLMEDNKSPGIDGLPKEFYVTFWEIIKADITHLYNYILFNRKQLSDTQKLAIISLIPKKDDLTEIKNWRPISLLNCDYKLLTKTLSIRLKSTLHHIIGAEQTCSVPNRQIFSNLYYIRDLIQYANNKKIQSFILNFDQEKAFDKVDIKFLLKTLKKFNFGDNFISIITTLYTNIKSTIINNGFLSETFAIERGVRQGCPLSLPLYCIIAEVLATNIKTCQFICGFPTPGKKQNIKLSQYADDTTIICTNTQSIHHIFNIFHQYEIATGATLNQNKTKGLELGGFNHNLHNIPFPITWEQHGIKILGIKFHNDNLYMSNLNWSEAITKLQNKSNFLQFRYLSFKGKALLINTILLSKIWFLANIFIIPIWARKKINQIIHNHLWDTNSEPINRSTLSRTLDNGGLNILNISNQNQSLLIKRTLQITNPNNNDPWVFFARYWLAYSFGNLCKSWNFLKNNNSKPKYIGPNIPIYYQKQVNIIRTHKQFFTNLQSITTKSIYKYLQNKTIILNSLTGETYWNRIFQTQLKWNKIWVHNFNSYTQPKIQNILFKIHHRILPTNAYISKWKRHKGSHSSLCKTCGIYEDILHIFAQCTVSVPIWKYFKTIITKIDSSQIFTNEEFTLTINLNKYNKNNPTSKLILTIIHLILNQIWICRNTFKFENIQNPTIDNIQHIINNIKHIISTKYYYHKRNNDLLEFKRLFAINNALCSLNSNNELQFQI